jgi:predicted nucleic acid-binding protein
MGADRARRIVLLYGAWPVVSLSPDGIVAATHIQQRHRIAFWDALLVEAARIAGATRLLTEDLNAGQLVEGVRIVNPFVTQHEDPGTLIAPGRS